jgi:two-component system, cell cycle sensor histidine kinase and response regulator CckA
MPLPFSELWKLGALPDRDALLGTVESIVGLGTWVWDVTQNRVAWSDELYRILGYEPGRDSATVENFFAAVHPEDLERVREVSARSATTGHTPTLHCRVLQRASGKLRHVRLDGFAVYGDDGQLARLIGTVLDTTETRSRERELSRHALLLNEAQRIAHLGSWYWEPESGRIEWSDELYRILGVGRDVPLSEQVFLSLVHPDDVPQALAARERALRGEHTPTEIRMITPDGEPRIVVMQSREPGDGGAMVGIVLDVTERRRLQEELLHAQKMEAVGRLAGGIAHDFNNLLAVIQGSAELLQGSRRSPELDDILEATSRGAALTRQLLAFSRRAVVRPTVVDLNERVLGAARLVRRLIGEDVRVNLDLGAELWNVRADAPQLEQVLMNLSLNARDAMPAGGSLTIHTENIAHGSAAHRPYADDADQVLLAVTDTGVGMSAATRARVFEPFFTTKAPGHGTGLGLATVFGVVEQSDGKVSVESEPGRGSTFRIYLPRVNEAHPSPASPQPALASCGKERVLLVEDNDHVRSVMLRVLSDAGYRVSEAADAESALELARGGVPAFDVLVTDVVMPGRSGRELARALDGERLVQRVLYVTGYAPRGSEEDVLGSSYLQKPFGQHELLATVRRVLDG